MEHFPETFVVHCFLFETQHADTGLDVDSDESDDEDVEITPKTSTSGKGGEEMNKVILQGTCIQTLSALRTNGQKHKV